MRSGTAEATARKIGWIREAAGPRFTQFELEVGAYSSFVEDGAEEIVKGLGRAMNLSSAKPAPRHHWWRSRPAARSASRALR